MFTKRLLMASVITGAIFAAISVRAASVKETFEMMGLTGTWATECKMPMSELNPYVVFRPLENSVQREVMLSATARSDSSLIDRAESTKPNEVFMSMANAKRRLNVVVVLDTALRMRTMESAIENGAVLVAGGRLTETGGELPWLSKCAQ